MPEVARAIGWNTVTVYRKENGEVPSKYPDILALCRLYSVNGEMTDALVALAHLFTPSEWNTFVNGAVGGDFTTAR